jgi:hypothetical protein
MTADLANALLNRAANGNELLQILETISAPEDAAVTVAEPTLEPLDL